MIILATRTIGPALALTLTMMTSIVSMRAITVIMIIRMVQAAAMEVPAAALQLAALLLPCLAVQAEAPP